MTILILNHYEQISPRVANEIKILCSNDYRVKILYWDRKENIYKKNNSKKQNEIRICLKAPKSSLSLLLYCILFYIKAVKVLKNEVFDIVHCTHFYLLPLALFLGKWKKVQIVYDAYEMYSLDFSSYVPKMFSKFVKFVVEIIENFLVSKVDGVITIDSVGNFLAKRYLQYNKNVVVLYNVPDKEPKMNLNRLQNLKKRYKNKKILIYIGGIFEAKGSVKALEALALVKHRFPEVKLLMIGKISDPPGKLDRLIKGLNIKENVEFISWVPYEEMFCYLKIAHVGLALQQPVGRFLLVSKGNGRKFFTYMQAGLPIVAPNFGEIGLVVKEEKCGILVDTTKPKEIADAIIYLLEHPEEAKAMGERGKKAIKEKYNWEIEKEKLLKVYKKLLERKEKC